MSLENLRTRLEFAGGLKCQDRMISDKLISLKSALKYSYNSHTITLENMKKFRGLINDDSINSGYTQKMLSIPYEDVCLDISPSGSKTSSGLQKTNINVGQYITIDKFNTKWIITRQYTNELAYFKGDIVLCDYTLEIDGKEYPLGYRSVSLDEISWHKYNNAMYNELNNHVEIIIQDNEKTRNFFHRFNKIKINNLYWEIQNISYDNKILKAILKETYKNTIEEEYYKEIQTPIPESLIEGDNEVYPLMQYTYKINNGDSGKWSCESKYAKLISYTTDSVTIEIIYNKNIDFILTYTMLNNDIITKTIRIKNL